MIRGDVEMKLKILVVLSLLIFSSAASAADQVADTYFYRGVQQYLKGNLDDAIADVEKAMELGATGKKETAFIVKLLLERGSILFQNRQYQDARDYFEKALKYDPANKEISQLIEKAKDRMAPATAPAAAVQQVVPDKSIVQLIQTIQSHQDKLIESVSKPNEIIRQILVKSDEEREKYLAIMEKKNDVIVDAVKSEKTSVKSIIYIGAGVVIFSLVIIFVFMYIFYSRDTGRREAMILSQQAAFMNALYRQQEVLAQGSTTLRLTSGTAEVKEMVSAKEMLGDPNSRVRARGIEIIEAELVEKKEDPEVVAKLMDPFLNDKDNRVRGNAVKVLYKYQPEKAMQTVREMLNGDDRWMKISAAWVLGELAGSAEAVDVLFEYLEKDKDFHFQQRSIKSLMNLCKIEPPLPEEARKKAEKAVKSYTDKQPVVM